MNMHVYIDEYVYMYTYKDEPKCIMYVYIYVEYEPLMAVVTLSISGRAIFVICWNSLYPSLGV
jgi:hypothetical protein